MATCETKIEEPSCKNKLSLISFSFNCSNFFPQLLFLGYAKLITVSIFLYLENIF